MTWSKGSFQILSSFCFVVVACRRPETFIFQYSSLKQLTNWNQTWSECSLDCPLQSIYSFFSIGNSLLKKEDAMCKKGISGFFRWYVIFTLFVIAIDQQNKRISVNFHPLLHKYLYSLNLLYKMYLSSYDCREYWVGFCLL
jgi:hypothetical protein